MTPGKPIVEVSKFYTVDVDNYEAEFGLLKGQCILVVGEGFFPISAEDPYLFRRYFAIAPFENGTLDTNKKPLVVSPDSLGELPEETQASLQHMLALFEQQAPCNA